MQPYTFVLAVLIIVTCATGQNIQDSTEVILEDPWFGYDKVQHFTFSLLWVLSAQYVAVNKIGLTETEAAPISVGSGAALGLLKEVRDGKKRNNRFSVRDLIANGVGLLCGYAVINGFSSGGT